MIQNTGTCRGLVVHTATDCKLIMNQGKYQFKQSKLYIAINYLMLFNTLLILVFAGIFASLNYGFNEDNQSTALYIFYGDTDTYKNQALKVFFSFYLLLNQFVPLELLIILEMVQIFVVMFYTNDSNMLHIERVENFGGSHSYEIKSCQVQNMSLLEDLGRVNFLFCDKTGTLTKNELKFKKWCCDGVEEPHLDENGPQVHQGRYANLLRCMVLCHDVVVITLPDKDGKVIPQKSGASQDELCFLEMLEDRGLAKLVSRDSHSITVEVLGVQESYDILKIYEFSSDRKMMSICLRNRETNKHFVFVKGATDAISNAADPDVGHPRLQRPPDGR